MLSQLVNFNSLEQGSHNLKVYGDGTKIGDVDFKTAKSGGTDYLKNTSKLATIANFPSLGSTANIEWSESKQNFTVTKINSPLASNGIFATNSELVCPSNPYSKNAEIKLLLNNNTNSIISKINYEWIFSANGLLVPISFSLYHNPAGGIIGPNSSKNITIIMGSSATAAAFEYCSASGKNLFFKITGASDENGNAINIK